MILPVFMRYCRGCRQHVAPTLKLFGLRGFRHRRTSSVLTPLPAALRTAQPASPANQAIHLVYPYPYE
ncbi:MAG: hypothetical protein ABI476_07810 [Oxalobacteraceae bacterium]